MSEALGRMVEGVLGRRVAMLFCSMMVVSWVGMWTVRKCALGDVALCGCPNKLLPLLLSELGGWSPVAYASVLVPKSSTLGLTQSASKIELCSLGRSSDEST